MNGISRHIFLVRHGETDWNKQDVFRGHTDIPLNAAGRAQAEALGRRFAQIPLQSIHSSRLSRALDIARAIAQGQKSPPAAQIEEGLLDIHRGQWEGLSHEEARKKFPEMYRKWLTDPAQMRFPGGESLRSVQHRAWRFLGRMLVSGEGSAVLVSHDVVIRVLFCSMLDLDLSFMGRFEVHPASVSEIRCDGGRPILSRINDICHLGTK